MSATMTIGAAASAVGLTRKAVRLYEARGLLPAATRTQSGYRTYSEADLSRLRLIAAARNLGLHLDQIADILAAAHEGQRPCATTRHLLDQRIGEIDRVVTELTSLRATLAATLDRADTDLVGKPGICPIIEVDHPAGTSGQQSAAAAR